MREHDRERHQLVGLGARVAEHQALVAGAARVDAHRDVGRLAVDRRDDRAGFGVEPELAARVPDVVDGLANHLLVVDDGRRRDLAGDEGNARGDERLAGDAAFSGPSRGSRRESNPKSGRRSCPGALRSPIQT